jgi:hypothetical protein
VSTTSVPRSRKNREPARKPGEVERGLLVGDPEADQRFGPDARLCDRRHKLGFRAAA